MVYGQFSRRHILKNDKLTGLSSEDVESGTGVMMASMGVAGVGAVAVVAVVADIVWSYGMMNPSPSQRDLSGVSCKARGVCVCDATLMMMI